MTEMTGEKNHSSSRNFFKYKRNILKSQPSSGTLGDTQETADQKQWCRISPSGGEAEGNLQSDRRRQGQVPTHSGLTYFAKVFKKKSILILLSQFIDDAYFSAYLRSDLYEIHKVHKKIRFEIWKTNNFIYVFFGKQSEVLKSHDTVGLSDVLAADHLLFSLMEFVENAEDRWIEEV